MVRNNSLLCMNHLILTGWVSILMLFLCLYKTVWFVCAFLNHLLLEMLDRQRLDGRILDVVLL